MVYKATVEALDWCPFKQNLLVSGGSIDDGTIKLWNANNGSMINSIKTGLEISDLLWNNHHCAALMDIQMISWCCGSTEVDRC